jgi:hypothetical protein
MGCDAQTQGKTGPVMDSTHQCEGEYDLRQPEGAHEKSKLEEPGDKADQEKDPHTEIQAPSDNLHVHIITLLLEYSVYAGIGDGTCGSGSPFLELPKKYLSRDLLPA